MTVVHGPCTWEVSYETCSDEEVEKMTPAQRERFEAMATAYLWNFTLRQFGTCPVVIRPCTQDCTGGMPTFWGSGPYPQGGHLWAPVWANSQWRNPTCGVCAQECQCVDGTRELALPGPVASVTAVKVDGATLVAGVDYRVVGNRLVRLGPEPWPVCQDMYAAATEPNTWEITYELGTSVPPGGQIAAGILALEFFKASCNDATCALPKRLQNITRQGVTVTLLDNFENLEKGQTGLWLVDSWVASVVKTPNPPGRVYSPDIPRPRHRVIT